MQAKTYSTRLMGRFEMCPGSKLLQTSRRVLEQYTQRYASREFRPGLSTSLLLAREALESNRPFEWPALLMSRKRSPSDFPRVNQILGSCQGSCDSGNTYDVFARGVHPVPGLACRPPAWISTPRAPFSA